MEDGTSERIGPYRLLRELGRGGQAVVYLAVDERLDRPVALKVLPAHRGGDLVARRFHREAMVASRLDHPGICPVFDAGTTDGQAFIAMRYVEGVSLSNWMTQSRPAVVSVSDDFRESLEEDSVVATPPTETPASSPPSSARRIAEVLSVVGKLASAAHAAHEVGIVHRDLKPGNVILTTSGQPVILDFGLAGDLDDDLSSLTRSGDLLGTPAYMSPEQLAGHHIQLDRRTDVWSLGVMLYEALVGRRPFESPTREGLYQAILTKDPVDPRSLAPRIAPDLSVVVATALAKDRDRRYQSAAALAEDLRRVADEEPILAKPVPLLGRLGRWARRHPAISILSVLLTVSLVSALVLAVAFAQRQARTAETERRARIETLDLLAHSRLDQSVLARRSGVSGRRSSGLALTRSIRALQEDALRLGAAREIGPTLTALRSEVIALLQIGDAELVRRSMPPLALGGHLSPDGDYILLLVRRPDEAEMRVQLFDLERSATMGEPGEPTEMPAAAALGPEGTSFAMMQRVGSPLIVRDGIGARVRRELELPSVVAEAKPISLTFASSGRRVFGVFQLPDGGSVLVGFDVVGSSPPWTFSSARAIERFAISETRVATLDSQGAMCALDPRDGSLQQTYAAPDGVIEAIALSATGGLYRARRRSDGDLAIERLDAPGGFAIDPALAAIGRLAVSDDGRRVAYSVSPPQIRVHDLTSGSALAVIRSPHAGAVRNLMWRRDGLLASRGALGELATWRIVESEAVESIAVRSASGEPIRCTKLGVDPTSERVAISPPTGSALHLLERTGSVTTLDVAVPDMPGVTRFHQLTFSPDGGRLLCVHMRRASVIDLSGKTATVHRDGDETTLFTSGALDVEGRAVVAGTEGGRALLWDLDTGDRLPVAEQAASAMISEDGRRVATIRLPASLQNVSVDDRDGRPERPAFRTEEFTSGTPLLQWYMFGSGRLASTSHGNLQGFGVDTGTFVLWDLERGHKRLELPILLEEVPTAFSHDPSGDLWAMGSSKGRVTVYDLRRAEQLFSWDLETESVTDLAFRSDGAVLYASDSSATLRRLDLAALRDALAQLDLAW